MITIAMRGKMIIPIIMKPNGEITKEEAIELAGKLAVMADDILCEKVKQAALEFANT